MYFTCGYVYTCIKQMRTHIHTCAYTNIQTCEHTQRECRTNILHVLACHHNWVVTSRLFHVLYRHQILQQRHQIWSITFQPLLVVEQRHFKRLRRRFHLIKKFIMHLVDVYILVIHVCKSLLGRRCGDYNTVLTVSQTLYHIHNT